MKVQETSSELLQELYAPKLPVVAFAVVPMQLFVFAEQIVERALLIWVVVRVGFMMQDKDCVMQVQRRAYGIGGRVGPADHEVPVVGQAGAIVFVGV